MYNLNELDEFANKPDSELHESVPIEQPKPTPSNDSPNDSIPSDFFNSAGNTKLAGDDTEDNEENKEAETTERPKGKVTLGKVISGKATVNIINMFIPSFIVFALGKFGYNANKRQFKLTQEEKDIMSPVVQDCLDYIQIDFANPFYALAFVATMIYGSKVFDAIPDLKRMKEDIEVEETEDDYAIEEKKEAAVKVKPQYQDLRDKIQSTSIRREKNRLIIEALEEAAPADIIEAWKIYESIFPERNENYFNKWYYNNIELFPESLRFNKKDDIEPLE